MELMEQAVDLTKEEEPSYSSTLIQDGVVHVSSILTPEEQNKLLEGIREASSNYKPTRARNAKSNFMKTLAFDCKTQYHKVPQAFKDYSLRATQIAHKVSSIIPSEFKPDYITSFNYPVEDGRLCGHVDKVLGWVVLFSLGNTARFWLKGPLMKEKICIDFKSGDVLVFNGGTEYDIYHGIDEIVPDSCPKHLPLEKCRISLQMRQSERNDNMKWKEIKAKKQLEKKRKQAEDSSSMY